MFKKIRKKIESRRYTDNYYWKVLILLKDLVWYMSLSRDIINSILYRFISTFKKGKLPDFLIIGTQKGGTTSLWGHLQEHPQIEMSPNHFVKLNDGQKGIGKEIHFFDNSLIWAKGTKWYKSLFNNNKKMQGEATPYYMTREKYIKRMFKTTPNTKLIILLRNPVDRAYSDYHMRKRYKYVFCNFENFLKKEILSKGELITRGFYVNQLKNIFKYFSKEQVLILISERMRENPQKIYDKITKFLGIKDFIFVYRPDLRIKKYESMKKETRKKLYELYKLPNERLFKFLGYNIPEWKLK